MELKMEEGRGNGSGCPTVLNGCGFKEGRHLMVQTTTTIHGPLVRSKRRMTVRAIACFLTIVAIVTVVSVLFRSDSVEAQTTCTTQQAAAEAVRLQGGYVISISRSNGEFIVQMIDGNGKYREIKIPKKC